MNTTIPPKPMLMIGPLPPPPGGVANYITNMREAINARGTYRAEVFPVGGPGDRSGISQVLHDIVHSFSYTLALWRYDPQLVHVHTASYYSFLRNVPYLVWTRYFIHLNFVLHIHGGRFVDYYEGTNRITRWLIRWALRTADRVAVTSPSWVPRIEAIGGGNKYTVLPNGFDPSVFHPRDQTEVRTKLGLPTDATIIVTVGLVDEVKGQGDLVEAMTTVMERIPRARLYIIGDGPQKRQLADRIERSPCNNSITMVDGGLPSETIAEWMSAADLFALPSLAEGSPTVLVENMACGRPAVGTRVGGVPDLLEEVGVLCHPGNPPDLARAIIEALQSRWDPEQIAARAQRYAWPTLAADLEALYDVIQGHHGTDAGTQQ
jgi:glycosyltransferase involved in cell wall biosynthesis